MVLEYFTLENFQHLTGRELSRIRRVKRQRPPYFFSYNYVLKIISTSYYNHNF
jgi:hypothetical protein